MVRWNVLLTYLTRCIFPYIFERRNRLYTQKNVVINLLITIYVNITRLHPSYNEESTMQGDLKSQNKTKIIGAIEDLIIFVVEGI